MVESILLVLLASVSGREYFTCAISQCQRLIVFYLCYQPVPVVESILLVLLASASG